MESHSAAGIHGPGTNGCQDRGRFFMFSERLLLDLDAINNSEVSRPRDCRFGRYAGVKAAPAR
jgi:hypothetical protein